MTSRRSLFSITLFAGVLCASFAAAAAPASAIDYHRWFWTTVGSANPPPFSDCAERAVKALNSQNFAPHQSGTNPVFIDGTTGPIAASILCIQEPKGYHMTLLVMSDDPAHSSVNVGKAINAAFGVTNMATAGEGVDGVWDLSSNCAFASPAWTSTLTLTQAPGGIVGGSSANDALSPAILNESTFNANTVTIVLQPSEWASTLTLTGQLSGATISGKVHHLGSDDCTFSMVRA